MPNYMSIKGEYQVILIIDNNRKEHFTMDGLDIIIKEKYDKTNIILYPESKWPHPIEMCERVLYYILSLPLTQNPAYFVSHIVTRSDILFNYLRREVARKNIPPFDGLSIMGKETESFSVNETGYVSPWPEKSEILNFSMKIAEAIFRIQVEKLKNLATQ